jgi:PAS domain-containing protein
MPDAAAPPPVRKRFQTLLSDARPVLTLDRHGTIQSGTRAARQLLEHPPGAALEPCFFSHVHKRHRPRVMRDLADIVSRGKQRAHWLVRLRTGHDRWRWYRATVRNDLGGDSGGILVHLQSVA